MARCFLAVGVALAAVQPALAQSADEGWKVAARAVTAISAIDEDIALAPAGDALFGDLSLAVTRSDTFENGLTLGWRLEGRLQQDAGSRPGFAGVLGACNPSVAGCARLADGSGFSTPVSPATGLAAYGPAFDAGPFGTLEAASVSLSGSWGEGVAGYDSGVAARLDARPPNVLDRVSATSPGLDPTGLSVVRARNDVSGPSLKAAYMSPRWIGFRAGVSYAPEADARGGDVYPRPETYGQGGAELENVWEGALSFNRRFRQADIRVRAAVTATFAESKSRFAEFGDYEAWGAGLELQKGVWSGGVRWLNSNNAWQVGGADYEAVETSLVWQGDTWRIGAEGGWAEDRLTGIEGASYLVGASRKLTAQINLGAAYVVADADLPLASAGAFGHTNARNGGFVLELSVRN